MQKITYSTLVEKLDRNLISLAYAKQYVKSLYNIELKARTKRDFIKMLFAHVES